MYSKFVFLFTVKKSKQEVQVPIKQKNRKNEGKEQIRENELVPNYIHMYDKGEWDRLISIMNKNIMEIKNIKTGKSKLVNVNSETQVSRLLYLFFYFIYYYCLMLN